MINVALFGNTGLANGVFRALLANDNINLCGVFTRKLPGHFPYYDEEELWYLSEQNNIPTFTDENVNSDKARTFLSEQGLDYIVVASFDQIIKKVTRDIPKVKIINYHPSLLPKYRGPNPISWALINGETETGLSIHELTAKIDAGRVIYQRPLEISREDNLGSLYQKLSNLAEQMSVQLVEEMTSGGLPEGDEQNERNMSYYPKSSTFMNILIDESKEQITNRYRAFMPFPKPRIILNEKLYFIENMVIHNNFNVETQEIVENSKYRFTKENEIFEFQLKPIANHD